MEVADREEIGLLGVEPGTCCGALAPRAMPVATGVIGDPLVSTVITGFNVAAESCSAAGLDRRHDLELVQAQVSGMGSAIGRPGSSEDIGDLEGGAHAQGSGGASTGTKMPSLSSGLMTDRTVRVATLV